MKTSIVFSLLFTVLLLACQEEESSVFDPDMPLSLQTTSVSDISEQESRLFSFANETISGMYPVSFDDKETKILDKSALIRWIKANEKKKSANINLANRKILEKLMNQNHIQAILLKNKLEKPFQEAVYVLIPREYRLEKFKDIGAVLITDGQNNDDDDDDEEETEEPCYTQSGTYLDATHVTSSSGPSGCPPCLLECVACDSNLAGQDDCVNCSV